MKTIEFRIPMPMTVDEYLIGQMWAVNEQSRLETGGGEGVEIVHNEPFEGQNVGPKGRFSKGQYTYKIYKVASKVPRAIREDIVSKMCRNCIYFPESGDIPSHFGRTLVSQSHLAPLPLHVCPVYWDFDRSMWLYPLPDLVVSADKFDPFVTEHSGCTIVNPGSFAKNDFSFKTYLLKTRQIEDSQIPDED